MRGCGGETIKEPCGVGLVPWWFLRQTPQGVFAGRRNNGCSRRTYSGHTAPVVVAWALCGWCVWMPAVTYQYWLHLNSGGQFVSRAATEWPVKNGCISVMSRVPENKNHLGCV
jgi:hypothetical protein